MFALGGRELAETAGNIDIVLSFIKRLDIRPRDIIKHRLPPAAGETPRRSGRGTRRRGLGSGVWFKFYLSIDSKLPIERKKKLMDASFFN